MGRSDGSDYWQPTLSWHAGIIEFKMKSRIQDGRGQSEPSTRQIRMRRRRIEGAEEQDRTGEAEWHHDGTIDSHAARRPP